MPPVHMFVSVSNFCGGSQKGIGAMLKFFKTEEIGEDACPALKKMFSRLSIAKMTPNELQKYLFYKKKQATQYYVQLTREVEIKEKGREEGKAEGREEGERIKQIKIAKNMIIKNLDIEMICEITGLSAEDIRNLKE